MDSVSRPSALYRFACFLAGAVALLICSGGLVTSTGSGLAVPDWPNSYGYNMFTFPWARWASGGVFHEHSHRLIASGVGFLTILLVVFLARGDGRPWLRKLGWLALGAVILQGVLGGLRVVWLKDQIGIFHAGLAHAFFCLIAFIAFALSNAWKSLGTTPLPDKGARNRLRSLVVLGVLLIYGQLLLGATMRHAHADLSIRDFPLAYGQILPPLDDASIARINEERKTILHVPPTTRSQIVIQMLHRLGAVLTVAVVIGAFVRGRKMHQLPAPARRALVVWPALLAVQFVLGMFTIWTDKAADIATAHVAGGAASLLLGVLLVATLSRWGAAVPTPRATAARQLAAAA
ncbi:MAG: COX15/CtaA family protein [Verrucomicrobia bacterium]|nr:COX15/CtaA family protein [Verrucomicrobiota bacterium]